MLRQPLLELPMNPITIDFVTLDLMFLPGLSGSIVVEMLRRFSLTACGGVRGQGADSPSVGVSGRGFT
jgi:hypothetical protein